jgi:hypothetical protein
MTNRKFRVGDRVRWYVVGDEPLWNFANIRSMGDDGHWVEGIVDRLCDDGTFTVAGWWWPQPGHHKACYGEPGYLELIEAAKEPRARVKNTFDDRSIYISDDDFAVRSIFPVSCRSELESICTKLNNGDGEK